MFLQLNRAKRCLTLKPSTPERREIVRQLVAQADVVAANLPHAALVLLGLDYDSLAAVNPGVILAPTPALRSVRPVGCRVRLSRFGKAMSGTVNIPCHANPPTPH